MKDFIKKIGKGQIIFTVIYLLCAICITFLVKKCYLNDHHAVLDDVRWSQAGDNYNSEYFYFPEAVHNLTFYYSATKDTEFVIFANDVEVARDILPASEYEFAKSILYTLPKDAANYYISLVNTTEADVNMFSLDLLTTRSLTNDSYVKSFFAFTILMLGLVFILLLRNGKISKNQIFPIVSFTAILFFASSPIFLDYIPSGHDLWCHCGRIEGIRDAIIDGQGFPMIIPDAFNHYGILSFEYPEIFILLPGILRLYDVSMVTSYHVFLFLVNIGTVLIAYFSVKSILSDLAPEEADRTRVINISTLAAICYLLSSYRMSDMYIRAAVGETLAMMFLPLLVAGLYHVYTGNRKKWYMLLIAATGVLQSHVLSCFLIVPIIIFLMVPFIKQILAEKRWKEFIYVIAGFLLLNFWYIIPFVRFYKLPLNTANLVEDYVSYHMVLFSHIFATNLNTTFEDGADFTLAIGVTSLVIIIVSAIYIFEKITDIERFKNKGFNFMFSLSLCSFFVFILSCEILPLQYLELEHPVIWSCIQMLQFPYRFLTIVSVAMIFMLAIALLQSENLSKQLMPILVGIIVLALYDSGSLMEGYEYSAMQSVRQYTGNFVAHMPGDYLPADINLDSLNDLTPYIVEGEITDYSKEGTNITLTYSSDVDTIGTVPLLYYPCYDAVDESGNKINIYQSDEKKIEMNLPAGEHTISLKAKYSLFY